MTKRQWVNQLNDDDFAKWLCDVFRSLPKDLADRSDEYIVARIKANMKTLHKYVDIKLSNEEEEFRKNALLLGYNYLCRDEDCYIALYEMKPIRLVEDVNFFVKGQWVFGDCGDEGNFTAIDDSNFNLFDWVKWETGVLNLNTLEVTDDLDSICPKCGGKLLNMCAPAITMTLNEKISIDDIQDDGYIPCGVMCLKCGYKPKKYSTGFWNE